MRPEPSTYTADLASAVDDVAAHMNAAAADIVARLRLRGQSVEAAQAIDAAHTAQACLRSLRRLASR